MRGLTQQTLTLILVVLACSLSVSAQQIYIRNQPFEGRVVKDSGGLWVELQPLEQALDFTAVVEAEGARINGRLVRTLSQGQVTLVSLAQASAALGAVVREDPAFGTVDVYLAMRPKSGTAGLETSPEETPAAEASGQVQKLETAGFALVLPEGMQVTRDPRLIKAFLEAAGPRLPDDFKLDAMVHYQGDQKFKNGAAVFSWVPRESPKGLSGEQALLSFQLELARAVMDQLGVELIGKPEVVQTEEQHFVLGAGIDRAPPHHGMLTLLRFDPRRKRFYQVFACNIPQNEDKPTADFMRLLSTVTTR